MELVFMAVILTFAVKGMVRKGRETPEQNKNRESGLFAHELQQARQEWIERSRARHERRIEKVRRKAQHRKDKDQVRGEEWLARKNEQLKKARARREAFAARRGEVWDKTKTTVTDKARAAAEAARARREAALEDRAWDEKARRDAVNPPEASPSESEAEDGNHSPDEPTPSERDDAVADMSDGHERPEERRDNVRPLRPLRPRHGAADRDRDRVHVRLPDTNALTDEQEALVRWCLEAVEQRRTRTLPLSEWLSLPPDWRARILDAARRDGQSIHATTPDAGGCRRSVADLDPHAAALATESRQLVEVPIQEWAAAPPPSIPTPVAASESSVSVDIATGNSGTDADEEPESVLEDSEDDVEPRTPATTPLFAQKGPSMSDQNQNTAEATDSEATEAAGLAEITSRDGAAAYSGAMAEFCNNSRSRLETLQAEIQSLTESIRAEVSAQETALASLQAQGLGESDIAEQIAEGYEQTQSVETAAQDMDEAATELAEALQTAEDCYGTAEDRLAEQQDLQEQINAHGEENVADNTEFYTPA